MTRLGIEPMTYHIRGRHVNYQPNVSNKMKSPKHTGLQCGNVSVVTHVYQMVYTVKVCSSLNILNKGFLAAILNISVPMVNIVTQEVVRRMFYLFWVWNKRKPISYLCFVWSSNPKLDTFWGGVWTISICSKKLDILNNSTRRNAVTKLDWIFWNRELPVLPVHAADGYHSNV